jgi:hypothetical protein
MNPSARWLLDNRLCDVRRMSEEVFRDWLHRRVERWTRDPVFARRLQIRELRRSYPGLLVSERSCRQAHKLDRAATTYEQFSRLEERLRGTGKAVKGLEAAERWEKLASFQRLHQELQEELTQLTARSPERQALLQAQADLAALRRESGLDQQERTLKTLLRESGRGSGRRGKAFEQAALAHAETVLAPKLGADRILTGVTLAAADTEFDLLLVKTGGERAQVLAAVEAKRNVNDLAHGYLLRQRNLRWLAGQGDPQPTAYYHSGQFDRPYTHEGLVFTQESFQDVQLHMISRPGWVWGMSSEALGRLSHRVSTDVAFSWNPSYLRKLHEWTRGLASVVETPDLLKAPDLNLTLLQV